MLSTVLMKLLTVKAVATAAVATTVAGGVAAAAVTLDAKPDAVQVADRAGAETATSSVGHAGKRHDGTSGKGADHGKTGGPGSGPAGSPSPSLVGLCHAVNAGNKAEHGKALQSPAFRVLVTTAGGADKVDAFCSALLATGDKSAKGHPSDPATGDDGAPGNGGSSNGGPANGKTDKDKAGKGMPVRGGSGADASNRDRSGLPGSGLPGTGQPDAPAGP